MAREEGFFDELARGLADDSVTRGKALRLMGAALLGGTLASVVGMGEAAADREAGKPLVSWGSCAPGPQERSFSYNTL
jgi:hypothetical protein